MAVRGLRPDDVAFDALNNTFERALVTMHKMPRIWLEYLHLLMEQRLVTRTRRTFDRALASLPITQHDRIWQMYLVGRSIHTGVDNEACRFFSGAEARFLCSRPGTAFSLRKRMRNSCRVRAVVLIRHRRCAKV